MSNVHLMPGATVPMGEPVSETVDLLERLLVMARAGNLRSVAVVYSFGDHGLRTDWNSENEFFALIGGVGWLHKRMLDGIKVEPVE